MADPSNIQINQMFQIFEEVKEDRKEEEEVMKDKTDSNLSSNSSESDGYSMIFGGLIQKFSSKSESVYQNYRRDLLEFGSGLKKEAAGFREAATRAVKEIPNALEFGTLVAQEMLETIGQAVDNFGKVLCVRRADITSDGDGAIGSADSQDYSNQSMNSKSNINFDVQVRAIQSDPNTYYKEPEDLGAFNDWKLGFVLAEKSEEIENLCRENEALDWVYTKLVPIALDRETFWSRYFYQIHKLKNAEDHDAKPNLVKGEISVEKEKEVIWDVEQDQEETDLPELPVSMGSSFGINELEGNPMEESQQGRIVAESIIIEDEDSEFLFVSTQQLIQEEGDLSWEKIEDLGNSEEKKVTIGGSPQTTNLGMWMRLQLKKMI